MYINPQDKLRYCWRCRERLGRGPGPQTCSFCRVYNSVHGLDKSQRAISDIEKRVTYYAARARRGLDLFEESPWRRLPGACQRALEAQTKLTGTTGSVAAADEVE